ncbi:MAG: hypothetical protein N2449_09860 [Bacteroidales bacterium]|nr:hypothetical protein [Bacteroidales bacterium]
MKKLIFISVISTIVFSGCVKDYFEFDKLSNQINWNPNMAVPAIHSRLTLRDLIQDYDNQHLFVEDSTYFLYLVYNKQVFSLPAINYVSLPDQNFPSQQFTGSEYISQGFPNSQTTTSVTKNINLLLSLQQPNDVFDSLIFKDGTFTLNVTSSFLHNGLLTITFPTIRKNNLPYSKTVTLDASGSFAYTNTFNDLTDYKAIMPTANQLACEIVLTLTKTGNNAVLPTHEAQVSFSFNGIHYKIIFGNFGNRIIPVQEDTVNVEIFNNSLGGQLYFVNPKIKIHLYNSFGVPLGAAFTSFRIYSSSDQNYHPYNLPPNYNPIVIQAPNYGEHYKITSIVLDTSNFPQIRNIIFNNPRYVYLQTNTMMNPPFTAQYNYLTDTSRFAVNLEVELPLWGRSTQWIIQDTVPFDFAEFYKDSTVDLDNIEFVKLQFNIVNAMPTEAKVQIYLTDTLYNIIDSVFTPQNMMILQSGVINSQGKVISPTKKNTQVTYTGNQLAHLTNVKKALLRAYINTTNNGNTNVRFYSNNYIDIKAGIQVQAKINTQTDF